MIKVIKKLNEELFVTECLDCDLQLSFTEKDVCDAQFSDGRIEYSITCPLNFCQVQLTKPFTTFFEND